MDYFIKPTVDDFVTYINLGNINQFVNILVDSDKILAEALANSIEEVIRDKKQQENDLHANQESLF